MPKESSKPWHDWRNDGRELAIVVIGVLIALLLQQVAQDWDWRNKARQSERAMTSELLFADGPQTYQRAAMHPCVQARLDQIRAAVETGRSRAEIARLTDSFWLPVYTYDSNTYQEAIAAGSPGHIPGKVMLRFGIAYSVMPLMDRTNERESVDMARLHSFRGIGGAISDQESIQLLQAVEQLRNDGRADVAGSTLGIAADAPTGASRCRSYASVDARCARDVRRLREAAAGRFSRRCALRFRCPTARTFWLTPADERTV